MLLLPTIFLGASLVALAQDTSVHCGMSTYIYLAELLCELEHFFLLGQFDEVISQPFTLFLDQFGSSGGTGQSCAHIVSQSGSTISWTTNWTWTAGTKGVKSFTNVGLNTGVNKQLGAIKSIPVSGLEWSRHVPYSSLTFFWWY
jgi:hypothetical protein